MRKITTLCMLALCATIKVYGVARVSAAGPGPYNFGLASSWVPAGVPTAADDLTINAGTTITITSTRSCKNIVVNGTLQWLANVLLQNAGNYTLSVTGQENCVWSTTTLSISAAVCGDSGCDNTTASSCTLCAPLVISDFTSSLSLSCMPACTGFQ